MAGVDCHVVHDALVNKCSLGLSHSRNPIWAQGFPCSCYFAVALHADP